MGNVRLLSPRRRRPSDILELLLVLALILELLLPAHLLKLFLRKSVSVVGLPFLCIGQDLCKLVVSMIRVRD